MKRHRLFSIIIAVTVLGIMNHGLAQRERPTQSFMRQKLVYAQGLIEGISLERFDLILTNAAALRDMSQTNAFLILRNPDYLQRITNFQAAVDGLTSVAKNKQTAGLLPAYAKVSESCVDCHRYFRRQQWPGREEGTNGK